jgi:hypothetical protein
VRPIEAQVDFRPEDQMWVGAIPVPITNILSEFVRLLHDAYSRKLMKWTELSRRSGPCFRDYDGVEVTATFRLEENGVPTGRKFRSCSFLANGHGYHLVYVVGDPPVSPNQWDEKLMRRIVDATEITGK